MVRNRVTRDMSASSHFPPLTREHLSQVSGLEFAPRHIELGERATRL